MSDADRPPIPDENSETAPGGDPEEPDTTDADDRPVDNPSG